MRFELVGVPYTSMAEPGGIARAIGVLRSAGLVDRLQAAGDLRDAGDLALLEGDGRRRPSGLLNEAALARLVAATREAVASSHARRRLPLLVGGDCPVLLDRLIPLLAPQALAMLGPRDREEIDEQGASSLDEAVAMFRDDHAVRAHGASASAREAVAAVSRGAPAFWLHLDLDVLATDELAAVDYPQPGGLTWPELRELGASALTAPGCAGVSIAIYNPDRDPDGAGAERIVRFAADLVAAARE